MRTCALLPLTIMLLTCSERSRSATPTSALRPPRSVAGEGLTVHAVPPQLVLTSRDTVSLYYTIFEHELATRVEWRPCTDPATCEHVPAGGERRVPYARIAGYEPGAEAAIVYWWRLIPAPTGRQGWIAERVRSAVVGL